MNSQRHRLIILFSLICMALIFPRISSARFQEGFGLYGGFHSPSEASTDGIYGSGPMFGVQYKLAVSTHTGLASSIGVLQKQGDPYNDNTFIGTDPSSSVTFVPAEISYIINLISNLPETERRIHSLYIGVGVNHIWTRERAPGSPLAKGNAFGNQLLAGTTFSISKGFVLGLEFKYLRNRPLMKLDSGRTYRVQLDGTQAQMTFMWHFGD
ncbi:outer membrane beta-barrel protein [Candidatus Poribacteria bacterium]|nr:outer membrane beta-barrel protein [Candidatus Poribacteria bacterium]